MADLGNEKGVQSFFPALTIVGCGVGPGDLTPAHLAVVQAAEVLAGGKRLLNWFPDFAGETVQIAADAASTAAELANIATQKRVVVLASGDPLFFGVAGLFRRLVPPENMQIMPNITAAQAALAKLRIPWENSRFFSVHGRSVLLPWRSVLTASSAVVYGDNRRTAAHIARELLEFFPGAVQRPAAIVANLGGNESIVTGRLGELAQGHGDGLSMLILEPHDMTWAVPPATIGLPDDNYLHQNGMITHPEVRAVVLSRLRLRPGVMWDLGAGSGSVSIEAAGLCEQLQVFAVENKPERCLQIRDNIRRFGCGSIKVIEGDVVESLALLPPPDAVFVGGGGVAISDIVRRSYVSLRAGGRLTAAAVMEETRSALAGCLPGVEREIIEVFVRRSVPLGKGTMMKPDNPVTLFTFIKEV